MNVFSALGEEDLENFALKSCLRLGEDADPRGDAGRASLQRGLLREPGARRKGDRDRLFLLGVEDLVEAELGAVLPFSHNEPNKRAAWGR